ncbi:MAG: hypothetical protein NZL91_04910 [Thermoflexales bacterium]|nr:hypothetical protein [Thermoflexales bacterium]MCS7324514.1 hypothetical protein [Thermoflexales bacterium]MDW8054229.1 hypothetical protein [Anaerolineae bacterium]MDW8292251.1 hypothetical protein [Anaerolineae bacterium]
MNVPQKFGGLKLVGTLLVVWGVLIVVVSLVIGIVLLTGNFFEGYNRGINLIGWLPIVIGLLNGIPPIVFGEILRLLVDTEYNTRVAIQSAEQARHVAELAVKNSESLMKALSAKNA